MQIQGATALVAGGASGLGAATARRLAEAGADVTIAGSPSAFPGAMRYVTTFSLKLSAPEGAA